MSGTFASLSRATAASVCMVAPKLGQRNAEIVGRKGLSQQDIETLQTQRVVQIRKAHADRRAVPRYWHEAEGSQRSRGSASISEQPRQEAPARPRSISAD